MRRLLWPVMGGLLLVGFLVAPATEAASAANAAGTTDPVTQYNKTSDVRITMPDGVSLDSDEYVPTTGCPCPVILVQTPYRKSDPAVGEFNPYFPAHGYAEIVVDVRGTGSSEGYWSSFGPPEQHDSVVLVQWAAHRPFSNGTVGLAGVSYSAINQFLTVEQPGTSAVKAIFPIVPMGDAYRDVVFAGGNTDTGFIPLWLGLVNSLNTVPADDAQSQPAIALNVQSQHAVDIATFAAPAVADSTLGAYEHSLPSQLQTYPDQAYDGPFYRGDSPLSKIDQVHVPTFIVGGEYDLFQRSEPLLYRGLGLSTAQKKLVYGPWYHGSPTADLSADDGSSPVFDKQGHLMPSVNNLALSWFDHWLKGKANGIDQFPTVETFQIGAGHWSADTSFPAAGTSYQRWYLGASPSGSGAKALYDGSLSTSKGSSSGSAAVPWQPLTGTCSRSTTQWTAGLVAAGNCSNDNSSAELTGLSFTSAPFTSAYTLSGPIMADLWVSSTRSDTTLVTTVTDVHTDGTSDRLTAGSLVASLRAFTGEPCGAKVMDCSVYFGGVPAVPWHPYTRASQQQLTPGQPTEMKVEIFPTSAVIQPGDRLRFSITTGDLPHQGPNLSTLANSAGGVDTVYFGGHHASTVYLGAVGVASTTATAPSGHNGAASSQSAAAAPVAAAPAAAAPAATPRLASHAAGAPAGLLAVIPFAAAMLGLVTRRITRMRHRRS